MYRVDIIWKIKGKHADDMREHARKKLAKIRTLYPNNRMQLQRNSDQIVDFSICDLTEVELEKFLTKFVLGNEMSADITIQVEQAEFERATLFVGDFITKHGSRIPDSLSLEEVEFFPAAHSSDEENTATYSQQEPPAQVALLSLSNGSNSNPGVTFTCASFLLSMYASQAFLSWQLQLLLAVAIIAAALVITSLALNPATLSAAAPLIGNLVSGLSPLVCNAVFGIATGVAAVSTTMLGLSFYRSGFFGGKDTVIVDSVESPGPGPGPGSRG